MPELLTEEEAEILAEFFVPNLWMSESGIIYNVGQQIPHRPYVWMDRTGMNDDPQAVVEIL